MKRIAAKDIPRLTAKRREELKRLAALPDDQIDTSDMPEITDFSGGIRGLFARGETRLISIRLDVGDIAKAHQLAHAKGLPYQTYIKSVLHEALQRAI
jgi:predicted DNA binding CopG/RHH family protein